MTTTELHLTKHKHYDLAYRAHYNTSFTPEKRATDFCEGFESAIAELNTLGVNQHKIDKIEDSPDSIRVLTQNLSNFINRHFVFYKF